MRGSLCGFYCRTFVRFFGAACFAWAFFPLPGSVSLDALQAQVRSGGEDDPDIGAAREEFERLDGEYKRTRKLRESGSVSRQELRQAAYNREVARLDLATLLHPEREDELAIEAARLTLEFRIDEMEVIRNLRRRDAVSELEFQRSRTRLKIADAHYGRAVNPTRASWYVFEISLARFRQAGYENEIAGRLLRSGSLARSVAERAEQNFESSKRELDLARSALGLRATLIEN